MEDLNQKHHAPTGFIWGKGHKMVSFNVLQVLLDQRNTHTKYEQGTLYRLKVTIKVKVNKEMYRQT